MPSVFETFDETGKLQLNNSLITYQIRKSGTGTTVTHGFGPGQTVPSMATISLSGFNKPLIAVSCGVNMALHSIVSGVAYYAVNGPVGTSFTYYIYDRASSIPAPLSPGEVGIELYNDAGVLTYSSKRTVMCVRNLMNSGNAPITHSGKTLAVCQGTFQGYSQVFGGIVWYQGGQIYTGPNPPEDNGADAYGYQQNHDLYGGYITNSGQTANIGTTSYSDRFMGPMSTPYSPPLEFNVPASLFVVDVTGIPIGQVFF